MMAKVAKRIELGVRCRQPDMRFSLNMDYYLRNSCGLVVAAVKARPNSLGTIAPDTEFSFETDAAVSQQGMDVEDTLLFQSFTVNE